MLYLSVRQCDETPLNTLDRFHLSIAFHTVSCFRSSWWTGINTLIFKLPTLLVRWMSCFIAYGLGILTYASVKGHHVFKHPFILNKNVLTQWEKKMKILNSLIYYLSSARGIYNKLFNKCYFELNKTWKYTTQNGSMSTHRRCICGSCK